MAVGSLWRRSLPMGWATVGGAGLKNQMEEGSRKSISDLPQKIWEVVPCFCQLCGLAEAGDLCGKATEQTGES